MEDFLVVGIGASAGGIEALLSMFAVMPSGRSTSFVVVQHLSPKEPSHLREIIAHRTEIPVVQLTGTAEVQSGVIYLASPEYDLKISGRTLYLTDQLMPGDHHHPIDRFFQSLAIDQLDRAVGIVLAGTGSNGAAGLRFVKSAGGLTIAQEPSTASFDGMPRNAIDTGAVDLVLAPADIPRALDDYARSLPPPGAEEPELVAGLPTSAVQRLVAAVDQHTGHDFRNYRMHTLVRRTARRMGIGGYKEVGDYLEALDRRPGEAQALANDIMIGVTNFFRDPDAWQVLVDKVIDPLVTSLSGRAEIRAWTVGCASGEEAYSLAMLLYERASVLRKSIEVRIFATDISEEALARARRGVYPASVALELGEERLDRFFEQQGESFYVNRTLRDAITFARHNILQDPPFSRLDLIVCRNLLIYLEPNAQERALHLCHFALRPFGNLFLGSAETVGRMSEFYEPICKSKRIYRRIGQPKFDVLDFPRAPTRRHDAGEEEHARQVEPGRLMQKALAETFGPAAVLLDHRMRVIYQHGPTDRYLWQPSGPPSSDITTITRPSLALRVRSAVQQAARAEGAVIVYGELREPTGRQRVKITAIPIAREPAEKHLLVTFEPPTGDAVDRADPQVIDVDDDLRIELERTQAELQATVEELETSNEELKASNEEMVSVNEELQSTNEELEASKEELQSLNEELSTVNVQLNTKVEDLERATNDLSSLLRSTEIATVFLDGDFKLRWFTPNTTKLINLMPGDIGRSIRDFAPKYSDGDLLRDAEDVLASLVPIERDIADNGGRWFRRRILPYRTNDNRIDGVVITFDEVTMRRWQERRDQVLREVETLSRPLSNPNELLQAISQLATSHFGASRVLYGEFQEDGNRLRVLHEHAPGLQPLAETVSLPETRIAELRHGQAVTISIKEDGEGARPAPDSRSILMVPLLKDGRLSAVLSLHMSEVRDWSSEDIELAELIADRTWHGVERARAEVMRETLVHELQHRVKNNLAMVQSIFTNTLRQYDAPQDIREVFLSRLQALSRAQDALKRDQNNTVGLAEIVQNELAQIVDEPRRRVAGDAISLHARAGLALSLVFHELATNALKYGALGAPEGRVDVAWHTDARDRLELTWNEAGGPSCAEPGSIGFGMMLMRRVVTAHLGGELEMDWGSEGLHCRMVVPRAGVSPG